MTNVLVPVLVFLFGVSVRGKEYEINIEIGDTDDTLRKIQCSQTIVNSNGTENVPQQAPSYGWVPSNSKHPIPENAVKCCQDEEGNDLYFGQTLTQDKYLVGAKIISSTKKALYALHDQELTSNNYMILVNNSPKSKPVWVTAKDGEIPQDAVFIGYSHSGVSLYVGRTFHNGFVVPGYIVPRDGVIWMSQNGKAYSFANYEVLVNKKENTDK